MLADIVFIVAMALTAIWVAMAATIISSVRGRMSTLSQASVVGWLILAVGAWIGWVMIR